MSANGWVSRAPDVLQRRLLVVRKGSRCHQGIGRTPGRRVLVGMSTACQVMAHPVAYDEESQSRGTLPQGRVCGVMD